MRGISPKGMDYLAMMSLLSLLGLASSRKAAKRNRQRWRREILRRRRWLLSEQMEDRRLLSSLPEAAYFVPEQHALLDLTGFLTGPSSAPANDIARNYMLAHASQLELSSADIASARLTDQIVSGPAGTTHLYLEQTINGLEVVNARINVNVSANGEVISVGGGFVPSPLAPPVTPFLTAPQAVVAAATNLGLHLELSPTTAIEPSGINQATVLDAKELSLDPIPARLDYVATPTGLNLSWDLVLRTTDGAHWYNVNVDAATGELLLISDWTDDAAAYNVFPMPIENPLDGPRQIVVNPANPIASPFGWNNTSGPAGTEFTDTRGNNVFAQEDADDSDTGGFRPDGGRSLQFDYPLNLAVDPVNYQPAAVTSLFYWNNVLHDVHQRYGFTEAAGNFQLTNYGGAGLGNDPVLADAQDGSGTNNANFSTPPDGTPPRMQQYLFTTTPRRDSDLDAGVIVHEYGHGVSNRLTGGPANSNALRALQERAAWERAGATGGR